MRHVYSVVRFFPRPHNGECVNIGLLIGSESTGQWDIRIQERKRSARMLDESGILPGVFKRLKELQRRLVKQSLSLAEGHRDGLPNIDRPNEEWLWNMANQFRGVLQFSYPSPIDVDTVEEGMNLLWYDMVGDGGPRRRRVRDKRAAQQAMRMAFQAVGIGQANLLQGCTLRVGKNGRITVPNDFAVYNGAASHFVQCYSFQLEDTQSLQYDIQSWAYAMRHLRSNGGIILEDGEAAIPVVRDAVVDVVCLFPDSEDGEETFNRAQAVFDDIGVDRVVKPRDALQIAEGATESLHGHAGSITAPTRYALETTGQS